MWRTQSGTSAAGNLGDRPTRLEHGVRYEALEVREQQQVRRAPRRDCSELSEAVPQSRVERRADERILDGHAGGDGIADHRVDVAVVGDVLGLPVVGAERDPARPVLEQQREQGLEVPGGRSFADQQPHPGAQALAAFLRGVRLVVGADAGGGVRLQRPPAHARGVPVDVNGQRELVELRRRPTDHAREVHHLCEPDHAPTAQQGVEVAGRQCAARRFEVRRRHARRRHEVDVQRQACRCVEEPVDAVSPEHVGDLVRVGDHRRRPEWEHEPRELVDQQLRRFEVHVRVDESGNDVPADCVDDLLAVVRADPGDHSVGDRDVGVEPFSRERGEDPAAMDDDVGRLVPAGDCQPSRQGCSHGG